MRLPDILNIFWNINLSLRIYFLAPLVLAYGYRAPLIALDLPDTWIYL